MSYSLPSQGSNLVPVRKAKEMIAIYSANKNNILASEYRDSEILATSETFNADDVRLLLSQPDCVGFRVLYGMDSELKVHSILVGVDGNGNDIVIKNLESGVKEEEGYVIEDANRCPPSCLKISLRIQQNEGKHIYIFNFC
ncbi:MAG: hypothetical protein ACKO8Q_08730 [Bacteroidota bacterium]